MSQKIFLKKTTSHKTYLKKQNEWIYLKRYYQRTIGEYHRPPYCCLQPGTSSKKVACFKNRVLDAVSPTFELVQT